jgi:mannose-6-phosphate isomerase-like protein (cupin superfamily)
MGQGEPMSKGYLYRTLEDAETVPCPCGMSTRLIQRADTEAANVHVTCITDSVRHHHRACTEIYHILSGRGKMELGDDVVDLAPGVTILIEPGTWHRAYADPGDEIRTLIVGIPAWQHDDEFFETS